MKLELSLHFLVCGRTRKSIRLIESSTNTAIYFPPPFPRVYGYLPPGAHRRNDDEVFITGESHERIVQAKQKLRDLIMNTKCYAKDVIVSSPKIDSILLGRLDKVRKVMEMNGSYVLFPQLGSQRGLVRVQGTEILHVERTVRELMALVCILNLSLSILCYTNALLGWSILQCFMVDPSSRPCTGQRNACSFAFRHSYHAF